MITTRWTPRTRRLLLVGVLLSVLIHVLGGALWAHASLLVARIMRRLPQQQQREEQIATSDVIHLERRTVPRPAQASRAHAAPRRLPRPLRAATPRIAAPEPTPAAAPELAHRAAHAPRRVVRPPVAKAPATTAAPARGATLSAEQIAQLNAQFAQTIAASRTDLATIQKQAEMRPVATKRYPMQFAGLQSTLQRGEGYIEPTTPGQRIGGTIWYYTHYTYMWPDGHLEDDDIPWPFHYPVRYDLFALHVHLIPLQLPPAGFRLTRPLKPFLTHFLATRGQG